MSQKGISLFQLNQQIKNILSDTFTSGVWIVAEISELRYNQNGHCYLELVEKGENSDQIIAKAKATIWSYTFRMLKPYFETTTGQSFSSGIKVLVNVSVEFQEIYGFSLNIKDIDPTYTLGDMARRRKEIIARLDEEGVLEMNKELAFPEIPKCIAIISSPTAAGYDDFTNQLDNNSFGYKFHYKLFPAVMQGNNAEESIIAALDKINEYEDVFDVAVIIRGGGSQADLNCFDSYWLAFNIAQFPMPVISGIGHERDETIVDLVAHTKVKTPTAAAEFLIDCFDECREYQNGLREQFLEEVNEVLLSSSEKLVHLTNKFSPMVSQILERKSNQLSAAKQRLKTAGTHLLGNQFHYQQRLNSQFQYSTERRIENQKTLINQLQIKLKTKIKRQIEQQKHHLSLFGQSVKYLNPDHILKKGYTLSLKEGKIIKDIDQLSPQDIIETRFANGSVESQVQKINRKTKTTKLNTNG
ncbi:exodeoxyribonuclease VII large subunit [Labilibaculum manganireducens]|uniref:Exodeoxyribonuclease 7 large subunit n=1 Tax=Labilibaculum manganireducens TaxID=1940525 RepID=A0A2N3HUQ0_9BACT|nr:exodeoxyribonuclease VII large subunit [Labilibaculum manganireducens]PKQ61773.1 exodeoxyribonuclease VII large subunit [Labilibaculum manganireducens]